MNDLDTLKALFTAAGLNHAGGDFSPGSLRWTQEVAASAEDARRLLKEKVVAGAAGWIQFADRNVESAGTWDAAWDSEYPLEAELVAGDAATAWRLLHRGESWTLFSATVDPDGPGLLEKCRHRRLGGDETWHRVSWEGEPFLRPRSAALASVKPASEIHNS